MKTIIKNIIYFGISGNFFILYDKFRFFDVKLQIISLSAGANKLSKIQERAEEYAALIIEELDPDNLGYIEVHIFFTT